MSNRKSVTRTVFSALAATTLVACATTADETESPVVEHEPDPALVAKHRVAEPAGGERPVDPAYADRMKAQVDRAQAYLDQHVVPDFDRALRETSGVSYETIKAEIGAALQLPDPEAARAAVEQVVAARRTVVDAALARLGLTAQQLGAQVEQAARTGEAPLPVEQPVSNKRGICTTGFEFEPFPPFFQASTFWSGTNMSYGGQSANVNGAITAMASNIGGWGNGGGWIRADNIPPAGPGVTTVWTRVDFSQLMTELLLYFPAFAITGIGLTIEVYNGGPGGVLVGNCRVPLIESSLHIGYTRSDLPRTVFHQCAFHHFGSGFFTTKVVVDAWASSAALIWGGFAQSIGTGAVREVHYVTCLD